MDEENNFNDVTNSSGENSFTEKNKFNNELLKTSKPNKSNKTKFIIIGAIVLIVLFAGIGVYAVINNNPKVKVFKGLKATSEELQNKKTLTEKIAGKGYLKDLEEKGMNQNMKFTINSTNLKELAGLNGAGISIDSSIDKKNKKLMFNVGGEYKGTSVAKAQFYTDNKKLMLSVPELYNSWFTCDAENIQDQYNSSLFAQNGKLPNQEISIKAFGDNDVLLDKEFYDNIVKGYLKANDEKLTTIGKNIKVEKSKETKNIEVGGVNQECTGYDVVISGKDTKMFIASIYDYLLQDESIKKVITEQLKYSYMQQNKKYSSPEAMVDDIYGQMKKAREVFENSITFDDVHTTIYIDKKGCAVSIDFNTAIDNGKGEKVDVKCLSDFKGKDNVGDIVDMCMELSNNGEKIKIDLDDSTTTKDDTINKEMNLVLSSDDKPINVKMKSEYNTKSGDFDASADLGAQGEGFAVSCNGNTSFDKSSKKLSLDFDKIDLKGNFNSEQINMSLDGSYSMAPLENPIEEPTGEKLELFKLSEDKLNTIVQEIQNNVIKIASAFM